MFNHILIPLDRSVLAECVLPHAIAIAHAFKSEVTLLHVMDTPHEVHRQRTTDPLNWQIRKADAQAYMHATAQRLSATGVVTETHILEGTPAEQVLGFLDTHTFQLVILSSHGQGGLSDWGVSSVVQKIVMRAPTSVMIVHASQPTPPDITGLHYKRILVPMDGTQRAETILPVAATLARAHDAEIMLVHMVQKPSMPRRTLPSREDVGLAEQLTEHNQAEASQYLDQLRSRITGKVETRILVSDHPTATLHELIEQEKNDLMLLSAHGLASQTRGFYGAVISNFITYGTKPLLIIRDRSQTPTSPPPVEAADDKQRGH